MRCCKAAFAGGTVDNTQTWGETEMKKIKDCLGTACFYNCLHPLAFLKRQQLFTQTKYTTQPGNDCISTVQLRSLCYSGCVCCSEKNHTIDLQSICTWSQSSVCSLWIHVAQEILQHLQIRAHLYLFCHWIGSCCEVLMGILFISVLF